MEQIVFEYRPSPRRRTCALRVTAEGQVLVYYPQRLSDKKIQLFIDQNTEWIHKALKKQKKMLGELRHLKLQGREDEALYILGLKKKLCITKGPKNIVTENETEVICQVKGTTSEYITKQLQTWYRRYAVTVLEKYYESFVATADIRYVPELSFRRMKGRWGSYSTKGLITLNTELIKTEPDCIRYVIAHELAHIAEQNHSPAFYAEMQRLYPEWKQHKKMLQKYRL